MDIELHPHWNADYMTEAERWRRDPPPPLTLTALRKRWRWPEKRPDRAKNLQATMFSDDRAALLRNYLSGKTRVILELGSWMGESCRFFLDAAPEATVICVDTWLGGRLTHQGGEAIQRAIPVSYDTFLVNLWEKQQRVIVIRNSSLAGMGEVAACGVVPDLIYIDADHSYEGCLADLHTALRLFPKSQITGDDYHFSTVKRAVDEIGARNGWKIDHGKMAWALLRE